jgi:hypothetical protein
MKNVNKTDNISSTDNGSGGVNSINISPVKWLYSFFKMSHSESRDFLIELSKLMESKKTIPESLEVIEKGYSQGIKSKIVASKILLIMNNEEHFINALVKVCEGTHLSHKTIDILKKELKQNSPWGALQAAAAFENECAIKKKKKQKYFLIIISTLLISYCSYFYIYINLYQ